MLEVNVQNDAAGLKQRLASLYNYLSKHLGIKEVPKVVFRNSKKNADDMLGKTGYYDPQTKTIVLYITGRHPKDILRSAAHELIHHMQNLNGNFPQNQTLSPTYAQDDPHMRNMEKQAYLLGNILFRDFCDEINMDQPINENLQLNPEKLKQDVNGFVNRLVSDGGLSSYHRNRTSGDMNPQDFTNDLIHDILSAIEKWTQMINNRGNQENQSNMIKEMSYVGNIGFEEVMKFFQITDNPQMKHHWIEFEDLLKTDDPAFINQARNLFQNVLNMELVD